MLISEHNDSGSKNFKLGHNQFSDWTDKEYEAILNYFGPGRANEKSSNYECYDATFPEYKNWVEEGFNGQVKD